MDLISNHYKILVISDYRNVSSSRPEAEIFIRLAEKGYSIHILSFPEASYYNSRFRVFGITVFETHPVRKFSIPFIRYLRNLVQENQYDVVHAFNSAGLTNAVWALTSVRAKLIAYRGYAGQTYWYDPVMYMKYFHPRVDHIICVSPDIERILSNNIVNAGKKLTTIPKGHDPAWYKDIVPVNRTTFGFAREDILICFVANLRTFKGLNYLLKATHILPEEIPWRFLFIGNGYDKPEVLDEMKKSPLQEKFHVLGFRSDALEIVAACDGLVSASTHGEGLSKTIVEAMSLGVAPVITAIPGNVGLVENGVSGWIVPPKDPEALALALTEMATDAQECRRRGQNAREHIRTHFHIDHTVVEFIRLYEKLNTRKGLNT